MAIQATSEEQIRMRRRARRRLLGAVTLLLMAAIFLPMVLDKEPRPLERDIEIRIPALPVVPQASSPPVVSAAPSAPRQPMAPVDKNASLPAAPSAATRIPEPETSSKEAAPQTENSPLKMESAPKPKTASIEKPPRPPHFVVQLGAFSSAENVRQLRERLSVAGIQTYTESLPNGATRVRAGPFTTREQADRAQAGIAMTGMQAKVISLEN